MGLLSHTLKGLYNGENTMLLGEDYGDEETEYSEPSADDSRGEKWRRDDE